MSTKFVPNPGSGKQRRLYRCEECKKGNFLKSIELQRRTRPKCAYCGSIRLEPSDNARLETAIRNDMAAGYVDPIKRDVSSVLSDRANAWAAEHPRAYRLIRHNCPLQVVERAAEIGLCEPAYDVEDAVHYAGRRQTSYIERVELVSGRWIYTDTDGNRGLADDFS